MNDKVDPSIVEASGDTRRSRAAEAERAAAAAEQAVADAAAADPSLLRDPNVRAIADAAFRAAFADMTVASPRRQTAAVSAENERFTLSQATLNELSEQGRREATPRPAAPRRASQGAPESLLPPGFDEATPRRQPAAQPPDVIGQIIADNASVEASVGRVIRREDGMPNATDRFLRELRSNPSFAAAVGPRDLDRDGQVTRDELKSHTDRILERSFEGTPVQQIALQLGTREEMAHVRQKLVENRPADMDSATHIAQAPRGQTTNGRGGL